LQGGLLRHNALAAVLTAAACAVVLVAAAPGPQGSVPPRQTKRVLAWADVRSGYQHESISHALATIERLGRQSGAYHTTIRTDS